MTATASTDTWFAGLFGYKHFNVTAHANACSPCSSTPVDIVIAIDRTGSMCDSKDAGRLLHRPRQRQGRRADVADDHESARRADRHGGIPSRRDDDHERLRSPLQRAATAGTGYDAAGRGYVTDTINGSYKTGAVLNPASGLVLHTKDGTASACVQAGGSTSYSEALRQAQAELLAHGRPNVPDYIVFLTDGEANMGSVYGVNDGKYPAGQA